MLRKMSLQILILIVYYIIVHFTIGLPSLTSWEFWVYIVSTGIMMSLYEKVNYNG